MVDFGRFTIGSPPLVWTIQFLYEFLTTRVIWADSFSDAMQWSSHSRGFLQWNLSSSVLEFTVGRSQSTVYFGVKAKRWCSVHSLTFSLLLSLLPGLPVGANSIPRSRHSVLSFPFYLSPSPATHFPDSVNSIDVLRLRILISIPLLMNQGARGEYLEHEFPYAVAKQLEFRIIEEWKNADL